MGSERGVRTSEVGLVFALHVQIFYLWQSCNQMHNTNALLLFSCVVAVEAAPEYRLAAENNDSTYQCCWCQQIKRAQMVCSIVHFCRCNCAVALSIVHSYRLNDALIQGQSCKSTWIGRVNSKHERDFQIAFVFLSDQNLDPFRQLNWHTLLDLLIVDVCACSTSDYQQDTPVAEQTT